MNHEGTKITKKSKVGARRALPLQVTICVIILIMGVLFPAQAQEATEEAVTPQAVEVEAADGLLLRGDYYAPAAENAPAVLLLHQLGSSRVSWSPLIPALLDEGYTVLAVDLRGHGETGGTSDWTAAVSDVETWLDWLRAQPGVRADAVSIIGASIGSGGLRQRPGVRDRDCTFARE
jgi:dipeptidyl aminopeptidase/acylaminoacyl peptidase